MSPCCHKNEASKEKTSLLSGQLMERLLIRSGEEAKDMQVNTPERRLWIAVILLACKDLASPYTSQKDRKSAKRLIESKELDIICEYAGLDPASIRRRMRTIKKGDYKQRKICIEGEYGL